VPAPRAALGPANSGGEPVHRSEFDQGADCRRKGKTRRAYIRFRRRYLAQSDVHRADQAGSGNRLGAGPIQERGTRNAGGARRGKPSSSLPELAPLSVQGLPNVIVSYWYGVFAPVGTPSATLTKIRDSLKEVFNDTDVRQKLAGAGLDPLWMDGNEFAAAIRADLDKYTRLVKTAGIKPE